MEKLKISYPVIVEGKYDKIKLSAVCEENNHDRRIRYFPGKEKLALIRRLSENACHSSDRQRRRGQGNPLAYHLRYP